MPSFVTPNSAGDLLREFNPNHDARGRFSSGSGGTGGRAATGARAKVSADWRNAMQQAGLRTDRPGKLPDGRINMTDFESKQANRAAAEKVTKARSNELKAAATAAKAKRKSLQRRSDFIHRQSQSLSQRIKSRFPR